MSQSIRDVSLNINVEVKASRRKSDTFTTSNPSNNENVFHRIHGCKVKLARFSDLVERKVILDSMKQPFQTAPQVHELVVRFDKGFL